MSYEVPETALEAERLRHRYLSEINDFETIRIFDILGVKSGWHCLEVGAGAGSIAMHLAQCVGSKGAVLATDIDMRLIDVFASKPPAQLSLKKHNILKDALPEHHFDLAHARALLQHLPDPDMGLKHMRNALKPGGWLFAEGGEFIVFDQQSVPDPFGKLIRVMRDARTGDAEDHHAHLGLRMMQMFKDAGLINIDMRGHVWPMRAGQPSLEWLLIALEWGMKEDTVDQELLQDALAQARRDDFTIMSPLHISVWGQVPA